MAENARSEGKSGSAAQHFSVAVRAILYMVWSHWTGHRNGYPLPHYGEKSVSWLQKTTQSSVFRRNS